MGVGLRGPCIRMTREITRVQIPRAGPCCLNAYLRARPNVRCLHCSPLSGDYLTLQHAGPA